MSSTEKAGDVIFHRAMEEPFSLLNANAGKRSAGLERDGAPLVGGDDIGGIVGDDAFAHGTRGPSNLHKIAWVCEGLVPGDRAALGHVFSARDDADFGDGKLVANAILSGPQLSCCETDIAC
jgi:hypothetical protein